MEIDKDLEETTLTTLDNPFNPFTQFEDWNAFDIQKGYNTCSYLARTVIASDDSEEEELLQSIDNAIDTIIQFNLLGIYCRINKKGQYLTSETQDKLIET